MEELLQSFHIKESANYQLGTSFSFKAPGRMGKISYLMPQQEEFSFQDSAWFCPSVFSIFNLETFYAIWSAILLERSVIFVSSNLTHLSSVILGFKSLLVPFKWCYAMIPILPAALTEFLEAPVPLLVGITSRQYKELEEDRLEN